MGESAHQSKSAEKRILPLVRKNEFEATKMKGPSLKNWILFFVLLGLTLYTTYLAGGKLYALSLFLILGVHEFGHYFAGVKNGVKTTLPLFIPAPPGLFLFGTFGAMIAIKDPIPNRRVLMEIGAAGPIAGFIVAVPTLIIGLYLSDIVEPMGAGGFSFGSSVIMILLSKLILGVTPLSADFNIQLHPVAFAGWVGLFVTAINLFPIGQLDGGHIIYSLFGKKSKNWAKYFFIFLVSLIYFWPSWGIWAVLLIVITRFKSAPLLNDDVLPLKKHRKIGYTAIVIFILTFVPVPIEVI